MNGSSISGWLFLLFIISLPRGESANGTEKRGARHYQDNAIWDQAHMFAGPLKDIEATNQISRENKRRLLLKIAKSHDVNNDDVIDMNELEDWVFEASSINQRYKVLETLKRYDKNGDDKVTFAEVLAMKHQGKTEKDISKLTKKHKKGKTLTMEEQDLLRFVNDDKTRFSTADINKDGVLIEEEMGRIVFPYKYPEMTNIEMSIAMYFGDMNKDGYITVNEFVYDGAEKAAQKEAKDKFKELDTNNDKRLSEEEIHGFIVPNDDDLIPVNAKGLMEGADGDKDSRLTMGEISERMGDFLFHSITDFSRHLLYLKGEQDVAEEAISKQKEKLRAKTKTKQKSKGRKEENSKPKAQNSSNKNEEETKVKNEKSEAKEKSKVKDKSEKKPKQKAKANGKTDKKQKSEKTNKPEKPDKPKVTVESDSTRSSSKSKAKSTNKTRKQTSKSKDEL